MSKFLHFKTSMFDVSQECKNPINTIYGISLLEWLREELKSKVYVMKPSAEDWGWYSEIEWKGNIYLIGSAVFYEKGDDPNQELEWVFQVDKYRSFREKLFGKKKITDQDSCF